MKKKIIIAVIVVLVLLLLVPIPLHLKDGGSVEYKALLYSVTKYHRLTHETEDGYIDGISIEILGKEIYSNLEEVNNSNTNVEISNQTSAAKGKVIIGLDRITNMYMLDNFIDNTNKYNDERVADKVEIITYTIEGDEILTTIEYRKEENMIILTKDNTKDEFASKENRKVTAKNFSFPEYKLAKIIKDNRVTLALVSEDDTYNVCAYSLEKENEKDTSRQKVKDLSLKEKMTSTDELVVYNGILYGKSLAVIDYAPNPNGPIDVINKLVGKEYLPILNRETNVEKLLNSYVDSVTEGSLVLNVDGIYVLYNAIDYQVPDLEVEIKANRSKENVTIEILEDTITKESVEILITDTNEDHYVWGKTFEVQKKENGEWEEVKLLSNDIGFVDIGYELNKENQLKQKVNYGKYYGKLETGTYRIVKPVYDKGYIDIYSNEFEIK